MTSMRMSDATTIERPHFGTTAMGTDLQTQHVEPLDYLVVRNSLCPLSLCIA